MMKKQRIDELLENPPLAVNRGFSADVSELIVRRDRQRWSVFLLAVFVYLLIGFLVFSFDGSLFSSISSLTMWVTGVLTGILELALTEVDSITLLPSGSFGLFISLPMLIFLVLLGVVASD